ncbi:hypothetical protein K450DRAFT_274841 [Umbelopsis ramanniana AG]|uniref:Presequence translocated-associated motor subunit PAM17 n=1 Tax=Umbelopsis ramanniana AG TaxID=1314678 RepID=A0AAD5HBK4_UMBRA|nr:uncharacterized protein K450DRAFT_274841 [Umbelopsis ramanniana AG]KAI8576273.1 hypothetical protein K450DRAFT_274841 [Umbelopsis ramanniana AG]
MATGLVSLRHLATRTSAITAKPVFVGAGVSIRSFATSQPQDRKQAPQAIQNWDDYFKLRAKRRNYERICCIPSSITALGAAGTYFTQLEIDPLHTVFGMEALPVYGMATVLAGFGGFLAGPFIGSGVFKLMNRGATRSMDHLDRVFYEHIKKNRADARLNSIRNPVPDYYGEKIKSVSDYRSWLRKQREHYRKGVFGGKLDED